MDNDFEQFYGITLPPEHRALFDHLDDPIHAACDFLLPRSPYPLLEIAGVNRTLHDSSAPDPWPLFLVAFASNGCGDYFAYDTRQVPYRVIYVDPDRSVAENLMSEDALVFASFSDWRAAKRRSRDDARR